MFQKLIPVDSPWISVFPNEINKLKIHSARKNKSVRRRVESECKSTKTDIGLETIESKSVAISMNEFSNTSDNDEDSSVDGSPDADQLDVLALNAGCSMYSSQHNLRMNSDIVESLLALKRNIKGENMVELEGKKMTLNKNVRKIKQNIPADGAEK